MKEFLQSLFVVFRDKVRTFTLSQMPRPDLNNETVEIFHFEFPHNKTGEIMTEEAAVFADYDARTMIGNGWIKNYDEYILLAALLFCHRFPQHSYSKARLNKPPIKYHIKDIEAYAAGTKSLNIVDRDLQVVRYGLHVLTTYLSLLFLLSMPAVFYWVIAEEIEFHFSIFIFVDIFVATIAIFFIYNAIDELIQKRKLKRN